MSLPFFRRTPVALGILTCTLTAAALAWSAVGPARLNPTTPDASLFPKTEKAKNPVTLQLQADDRRVVGWVSGTQDFAGQTVTVKVDGNTHLLTVGKDNTFTWPCKVAAATTAEFTLDRGKAGPLRGSVALNPPPAAPGPSVFFVVDRTAYRPGQPLHFAGFLRKLDAAGEFIPVGNTAVDVELTSSRKGTKAAKLKLTSDERGRIVGSYTFTDGDALDHYTLSVPGYRGSARVLLGEYRKSKVRLKIAGHVAGGKMKLTFEGLDFLDKPVPVTKASFTAQVVRRGKEKQFTLKGEDFVYHEARALPLSDLESLSEEDLLLWEAEGVSGQTFAGLANQVLTQVAGELKPDGARPIEHSLALQNEWRTGDCAVIVQGVITDATGREQRASATIPLEEKSAEGKAALELTLPKRRYFTTEKIEVRAGGAQFERLARAKNATLVVMKLAFQTPSAPISGFGPNASLYGGNPYFGHLRSYRSRSYLYRMPPAAPGAASETIRRTLVTAVPFKGDRVSLSLTEPGAYKLIATLPREDGTSLQQETTVVVKRLDDANALTLRLDREEYTGGGKLTGVLHSRFADAVALLTLRDSTGIRLTRPIAFRDGTCRLNVTLPEGLRYGCTVDVSYPEDAEHAHIAHAFARVVPADRMLTVGVKTPRTVQPGETVHLDLQVNRPEAVDLVVSVYDQSLLGIAADRSVDIRNFYLADERAGNRLDAALLQRRLGGLRLSALVKKAEALLKGAEKSGNKTLAPAERAALQTLCGNYKARQLYANDVATLLRLAGVDVYLAPHYNGNNWHRLIAHENDRLIDYVKAEQAGWRLNPRFVGSTLLLNEWHTSYGPNHHAWHPVYNWNYNVWGQWGYNPYFFADGVSNRMMLFQNFAGGMGAPGQVMATNGSMGPTGNASYSFRPEGQGFISHMPVGPGPMGAAPVPLLDADSDQSHIGIRRDFSDSAFWNATVRTDETGKASVSFKLPDSLTNWQVVVTAVSPKMHVGSAKASFRTFKPVMVWPMLPRTFTEGDSIDVFATVHNRTDEPQLMKVRLKVENGEVVTPLERTVKVGPKANVPVYWTFKPGQAGFTQLLMSAECALGSDASLKRLPVTRAAAEQVVTASGTVKASASIDVPEEVDLTASRLEITFAPSLAVDMADTLNYLVDYPYGCVEQTMSRFLPAIKVAQILRQFKVKHAELEKKLPGCVAGGIKRLLELQQPDGGWGWNGSGQTHEMMTPYALYGLLQAEKAGYQIPNEQAVARGLARLQQFIGAMGDAQTADRVYCMYVYSHRHDLTPEWWAWLGARVRAKALSDYALALALEMAVARDQKALAKGLALRLRERAQKKDGYVYWQTAGFSRWAEDKFEITAVALKALVAHDRDDPLIEGVLGFFNATKRGDRWNSTKDTAMILYALADYLAKTDYSPQKGLGVSVAVNGEKAQMVQFDNELTRKLIIPGERLKAGKNTLAFRTAMTGVLYRAVFRYWKTGRSIEPMDRGIQVVRTFHLLDDKGVEVKRLKSGDVVPRGSYVLSTVTATQRLPVAMRYVLVEDAKASGAETVPADDARFAAQQQNCTAYVLREDREAMTCFHHEQTPQTLTVRTVFLAELAGDLVIPPARVELMYQTDTTGHSGSFALRVADR